MLNVVYALHTNKTKGKEDFQHFSLRCQKEKKRKENIKEKAKCFFQIASAGKVKTTIILLAIVYCVSAAMLAM